MNFESAWSLDGRSQLIAHPVRKPEGNHVSGDDFGLKRKMVVRGNVGTNSPDN
jgi:hypothetical protein